MKLGKLQWRTGRRVRMDYLLPGQEQPPGLQRECLYWHLTQRNGCDGGKKMQQDSPWMEDEWQDRQLACAGLGMIPGQGWNGGQEVSESGLPASQACVDTGLPDRQCLQVFAADTKQRKCARSRGSWRIHGKEVCQFYCKTSQVLQGIHHSYSVSKSLDAMRVNQTDVAMLNIPRTS